MEQLKARDLGIKVQGGWTTIVLFAALLIDVG
jgi:hypothetical protein